MELGQARVFRAGVGGAFSPLSPLLVPLDPADRDRLSVLASVFQGASADHSHVYFKPAFSDTLRSSGRHLTTTYLEGDPVPVGGEAHVYVAGLGVGGIPSVELLARDADGRVWGERCGARVGGQFDELQNTQLNGRDQGAVSRDGSRVLFSTRPGQAGAGVCDPVANRLRVMRRVETSAGPWITVLSGSECDRVAPACDGVDGDDLYEGASVDGNRVYFTSNRQLADSDLDGAGSGACSDLAVAGCDLYMWDATRSGGDRLVQVSAGEASAAHPTVGSGAGVATGTVAISGDGSHVYFVAEGVLTDAPNPSGNVAVAGQRNLFVWDADQESLAFVGTLSGWDAELLWGKYGTFKNDAYPVPAVGTDANGVEVGGDGHVLVFRTAASLTGDDGDGGGSDIYRYDADAGELQRISAAAAGGSDNGAFDVRPRALQDGSQAGTDFAEHKRWVSEDGETIVFQTDEGLTAGDHDGLFNDYLWREGELYRLPGTSRTQLSLGSLGATLLAPALSHDGSSVAFEAITQLLPQDGDVVSDVYVARVGGGFALPDTPAPCAVLADGCQGGGPGAIPADAKTSSAAGSENASVQGRKTLAIAGLSQRARKRAARRGVLPVRVSSSAPGRVTLTARARLGRKATRIAGRTVRMRKAGAVTVRLRLNRSARERLASGKRLRVTVRVSRSGARSRAMSVLLPGAKS
ncbi:MAG TPA: hypothetical protein VEW67_03245 [Thermoleophilaceae bacterium]|nr:hypothetical protein [Thermoleophilaceae bacterium]